MKHVALLRGINVAGQKKVPMTTLRDVFESLKFTEVETYIQSGNVVFENATKRGIEALASVIEKALQQKFGFTVAVVVRTADSWSKILKANPYTTEAEKEPKFLHVFMLDEKPKSPKLEELKGYCQNGETFELKGSELYVYYGSGAGKSKLVLSVIEKKLGVAGTARNWLTMQTLADMVRA